MKILGIMDPINGWSQHLDNEGCLLAISTTILVQYNNIISIIFAMKRKTIPMMRTCVRMSLVDI
jgi:hypothetical protein